MNNDDLFEVEFEYGLNEIEEFEMQFKGYRSNVLVKVDGKKYRLCFFSPVRIEQDMEIDDILFDPGLVVIKEVSKQRIFDAIHKMIDEKYFEKIMPVD